MDTGVASRRAVLEILDDMLGVERGTSLFNIACLRATKGERDVAMTSLERAYDSGFPDRGALDQDPDLASLRDDPRVAALRAKVRAAGN